MVRPSSGPIRRPFIVGHHTGIDFGWVAGHPDFAVTAAWGGEVVQTDTLDDYGNIVKIDHGGGVMTRYCHLASSSISVGDTVAAGDRIGTMGHTGTLAKGTHLHWEYWQRGVRIDPAPHLDGTAATGLRGISADPSPSAEGDQQVRVISITTDPKNPTSYAGVARNNCFVITDSSYVQIVDLNVAKALAGLWNPITSPGQIPAIIPVSAEVAIVTFQVIDRLAPPAPLVEADDPAPLPSSASRDAFDESDLTPDLRDALRTEFEEPPLDAQPIE